MCFVGCIGGGCPDCLAEEQDAIEEREYNDYMSLSPRKQEIGDLERELGFLDGMPKMGTLEEYNTSVDRYIELLDDESPSTAPHSRDGYEMTQNEWDAL